MIKQQGRPESSLYVCPQRSPNDGLGHKCIQAQAGDRVVSDSSSPLSLLQGALASLIAIPVKEEQAIYGMENEQAIYGMEEGMMEPVRHNM